MYIGGYYETKVAIGWLQGTSAPTEANVDLNAAAGFGQTALWEAAIAQMLTAARATLAAQCTATDGKDVIPAVLRSVL